MIKIKKKDERREHGSFENNKNKIVNNMIIVQYDLIFLTQYAYPLKNIK